jgi:uncharacterized damage-inducible protein DinB
MDATTARRFAQYRAWADRLTYEAVAALARNPTTDLPVFLGTSA